jgi:hypothetical protein
VEPASASVSSCGVSPACVIEVVYRIGNMGHGFDFLNLTGADDRLTVWLG